MSATADIGPTEVNAGPGTSQQPSSSSSVLPGQSAPSTSSGSQSQSSSGLSSSASSGASTSSGPSASSGASTSSGQPASSSAPFNIPHVEYEGYKGNMTEYCKQLENWLWRGYWQRECAVSAYYTALSLMYPVNRGFGPPGTVPPAGWPNTSDRPVGINNNNAAAWNLNMPRGPGNPVVRRFVVRGIRTNNNTFAIDFNIAPIWKRFVAECIDFLILLVVKLFVTLTIIDNFDLIDLDNIDLDAVQEAKNLVDMAVALSWELVILEFTHRVVVCFFEAYCLAKGGATPGKSFMNLRVLHCEQVIPLANAQNNLNPLAGGGLTPGSRVLVSPGSFLNFPRALLRSTVKNFSLAFFFPLCFTLFHFEHNRTLYDLSSKSIVVEIRQQ